MIKIVEQTRVHYLSSFIQDLKKPAQLVLAAKIVPSCEDLSMGSFRDLS